MATRTAAARVRMTPESRREQLLSLGVRLLRDRTLEELSIDVLAEEAGISRGLLYHYFGTKQEFHQAVVERAVADLVEQTAPPEQGDPVDRLQASLEAYVGYVEENYTGYLSLIRGAAGGNEALRALYEQAKSALGDRVFAYDPDEELITDTPRNRMLVRGWQAMVEDTVLAWVTDPADLTRAELLAALTAALPAIVTDGG